MAQYSRDPGLVMMVQQRSKLAWPTLCASVLLLAGFASTLLATFVAGLSLWIAFFICLAIVHSSFAVAHEAAHGAISNNGRFGWIDPVLGTLHSLMLLYDFPTFKFLHLRHHANTNDAGSDPDYIFQKVSVTVCLVIGLLVPLHYLRLYLGAIRDGAVPAPAAMASLLRIGAIMALAVGLLVVAPVETFSLWLAPALIASSAISLSHRMLHTGDPSPDRKKTTLIVRGEKFWQWVVSPFFWLNNHHFLHHKYPALPCYTHEKLFAETKQNLQKDGVKIILIGGNNE